MDIKFPLDDVKKAIDLLREEGSFNGPVLGVASLSEAKPGDISFLGNKKYKSQVSGSKASVLLVPVDYQGSPSEGQVYFWVKNPSFELAKICKLVEEKLWPRPKPGIHSTAFIEEGARVADSATVGAFCHVEAGAIIGENTVLSSYVHVGPEAKIGDDCWLMSHVSVLAYCKLGNRVRIYAGAVIGSDGFGFETVKGVHQKVPQVGIVVIEDDVEVGANTTIDRARFSETRIGQGTKIDNLVQIAHNVQIGRGCLIVSQTGIAGSVVFEDYVVAGGQVGVGDHVRVGTQAILASRAGISNDVEAHACLKGMPPEPIMLAQRLHILKRRLPELFDRVKVIEENLKSTVPENI